MVKFQSQNPFTPSVQNNDFRFQILKLKDNFNLKFINSHMNLSFGCTYKSNGDNTVL